jgi:hypothetical protein
MKAGFTEQRLDELFVEFGQGFQSMSPALRDWRQRYWPGRSGTGNSKMPAN